MITEIADDEKSLLHIGTSIRADAHRSFRVVRQSPA
jgi:hypothetical protein